VRGNFDDKWLNWRELCLSSDNKSENFLPKQDLIQAKKFKEDDWNWLQSLPYYIEIQEYSVVVVHAGIVPNIAMDKQSPENLTTMRSLLKSKKSTGQEELKPSADFYSNEQLWINHYYGPKMVIFGHDAARGLQQTTFAIGLDTGAVYGNYLTAYLLPQQSFISVKAKHKYSTLKQKNKSNL